MADAVNADTAFFATAGSSLSLKTAMLSVAAHGDELLVARNIHKSVVSGLVLAGIEPVWVDPVWDGELEVAHPPTVESVERAWEAHPDAKGLLHIGPTDYGVASDLAAVVQACHRRGKPIIVDEAWGAHLPFHDDLPTWGMDADADVVVTSVHKAGSAFEQSSVFHLKGDRVDPVLLRQREDLLSTTSTSSLMYGAIDGWRRQMVEQGKSLIDRALEHAQSVAGGRQRHRGAARRHRRGAARAPGVPRSTRTTCSSRCSGLGITGYQAPTGCAPSTGSASACPTTAASRRSSRTGTTRPASPASSTPSRTSPGTPATSTRRRGCASPARSTWISRP